MDHPSALYIIIRGRSRSDTSGALGWDRRSFRKRLSRSVCVRGNDYDIYDIESLAS